MIADALSGFAARSTASIRAARDLAGRFWRAENGVALIEFAFTLPVMVILYLGSIVVTQGMMTDRKVTLLTRSIGDITSQDTAITSEERDNIFNAGRVI
ncbi:MAG: TadE/TadG family type IV pilus assembly protein, partial [Labrys sp. (in: a-proteobacteria)]